MLLAKFFWVARSSYLNPTVQYKSLKPQCRFVTSCRRIAHAGHHFIRAEIERMRNRVQRHRGKINVLKWYDGCRGTSAIARGHVLGEH